MRKSNFGSSFSFGPPAAISPPTSLFAVPTSTTTNQITPSTFGAASAPVPQPVSGSAVDTKDAQAIAATDSTEKSEVKPSSASSVTTVGSTEKIEVKPVFTFAVAKPMLDSQWRDVEWTEEQKTSLMKTVSSYRPSCEEASRARVLLLGPVGSGKSSFISSVQSVFNGRVTNRAMVGSSSASFTKKLQSFNIRTEKKEDPNGLVLCDVMGLGDGEMTGLTLYDILSVIKGHVPEGHKFSPDQPVRSETVGYVKRPSLSDRIHCVAFVVNASKILTYPKGLTTTFQQLREHISDLGVHQVALLTHIDQICPETAKDVTQVYKSRVIQDMMDKVGAVLGMSTSYIVPVKNYSSELDLNVNTDVLLLRAVDHILQYADLYFQDNTPKPTSL